MEEENQLQAAQELPDTDNTGEPLVIDESVGHLSPTPEPDDQSADTTPLPDGQPVDDTPLGEMPTGLKRPRGTDCHYIPSPPGQEKG